MASFPDLRFGTAQAADGVVAALAIGGDTAVVTGDDDEGVSVNPPSSSPSTSLPTTTSTSWTMSVWAEILELSGDGGAEEGFWGRVGAVSAPSVERWT